MTRSPRAPRITPVEAAALISDDIVRHFSMVSLTGKDDGELALRLGRDGIVGGKRHDLLHLAHAEESGAERIYTFNVRHSTELARQLAGGTTAP